MAAKHVYWIAAVMTLVAGYLCWSGAPLIWDGSYQLCLTLMHDRPFSYLSRFHSALLWQPTVWVSHFTDNLRVLTFVYGLPFCIAPVVGLLASWAVVRRESPGLMLWATMGILAGPLPGQIFIINDSILQLHLFWPVFMGMLVRLSRWQIALLAGLAVFQFSHPMGIATFFGAAMAAGIMAIADRDGRRMHLIKAGVMLALSLAAALKLGIWPDPYAAQEAGWQEALSRWHNGVAGWPIRGMIMVWIAAGLLLAGRITGRSLVGWIGLASLLIGAGIWIYWAADLHRWAFAIDYRRWLLPLSMPFFACATLESALGRAMILRSRGSAGASPSPCAFAAWVLTATFAIVLCLQGTQWMRLSDRLMAAVHDYPSPAVPSAAVPWSQQTALQHWATLSLIIYHQGKTPRKLMLDDWNIDHVLADPPEVPLATFHFVAPEPGPTGWFDCREVVNQVRQDAR